MSKLPGVISTRTGFMGGTVADPTYQQVCTKATGHAETVEVVYDTRELSTHALLAEFFTLHDFTVDRSENSGQYRSAIFVDPGPDYAEEQERIASIMLAMLRKNGFTPATELKKECNFYPAGNRHQKYCLSKRMVPKRRSSEGIRKVLTF